MKPVVWCLTIEAYITVLNSEDTCTKMFTNLSQRKYEVKLIQKWKKGKYLLIAQSYSGIKYGNKMQLIHLKICLSIA